MGGAAPAEIAGGLPVTQRTRSGRLADRVYVGLTAVATVVGVVAIGYLIVKTVSQTGDTWDKVGFWHFLSGAQWIPSRDIFGALPSIYGTLVTASIAMVIAVPIAVGCALATTLLLPHRLRGPIASVIDLLAAIPSVVYGLFGLLVLVPFVKPGLQWVADHSGPIGFLHGPVLGGSLILAAFVLAVMVLPIITAITREVLATVPVDQQEAAYALGATRWEMVRGAMLPWARSGIVGASALGLGRAVGETIAVAMVLGNSPKLWGSLLGSGQTMAGAIALEFNAAVSKLHTSSLVALAVYLFVVAFLINVLARLLVTRSASPEPGRIGRGRQAAKAWVGGHLPSFSRGAGPGDVRAPRSRAGLPLLEQGRIIRSRVAEGFVYFSLLLALGPLAILVGYALAKGLPAISWDFLTSDGEPDVAGNGIKHAIVGTLILMGFATVISAPLGILTALFMRESADRGKWWNRLSVAIGFYVDILLGVPSIVVGLTIYFAIVILLGGFATIAGAVALSLIMFPIVVRSADEIIRLVPTADKEAALALGAPRWRTTWSVVLPAAAPGLLTGVILALARASGETAPLLFTSGSNQFFSTDLTKPIAALPQYIFTGTVNSTVPVAEEHAWGAALVLIAIILVLSITARFVSRRVQRG